MTKDERIYAKFAVELPRHPKYIVLTAEAKVALYEATLWARENMTDGILPARYAERRWGRQVLAELCTNDDTAPTLHPAEGGGYKIHDYGEHQTTRAELEALQARNRVAGRLGGLAKARALANGQPDAKQPAKRGASKAPSKAPSKVVSKVVSENLAREESYGDLGGDDTLVTPAPAQPPPPTASATPPAPSKPPPCRKHPDGWHHSDPCKACKALREWDQAQEAAKAQATAARYERQRVIDRCPWCDPVGEVCIDGDWRPCTHDKAMEPLLRGLYRDGELKQTDQATPAIQEARASIAQTLAAPRTTPPPRNYFDEVKSRVRRAGETATSE